MSLSFRMSKLSTCGLLLCTLGSAAVWAPSSASALHLEEVTLTSDPSDVVITVRADDTLTAPSIKSYEGEVRIRFPASHVARTHQVEGDGRAISLIELRPGSHDTTVLRLDLADETKLLDADVRVEARKGATVFRIARDLLPPMRDQAAARAVEPAAKAQPVVAAKEIAPKVAAKPAVTTAKSPAKAAAPAPSIRSALSQSGSSPMPMLLAISALLGLAYVALRLFMRKQIAISDNPTIEVVAQKRLGARHQLVIVRAFGQDHLLSIQGQTTTPIASNDVGEEPVSLDSATRLLSARKYDAPSADIEAQRVEAPRAEQKISQPRLSQPEVTRDESGLFGGELLRLAIAQKQRSSAPARESMVEAKEVMLPAQAGHSARPSRAEEPTGNRGDEQQVLSKAVAGLVRLRREVR